MTSKEFEKELEIIKEKGMVQFPNRDMKQRIKSFAPARDGRAMALALASGYGVNELMEGVTIELEKAEEFLAGIIYPERIEPKFTPDPPVPTSTTNKSELPKRKQEVSVATEKPVITLSPSNQSNIGGLREHLFNAINRLEGGTMDVSEAKAMASVAQTIINSAKLELEYKRLVGKSLDIKMLE